MSTDAAPVSGATGTSAAPTSPENKGKTKVVNDTSVDHDEEEDDEDDEEDEDDEMDEDDDDDDEEGGEGDEVIDPSKILPRRTRGVKVDYSSAEALAKAGLKAEDLEEEADPDVSMEST